MTGASMFLHLNRDVFRQFVRRGLSAKGPTSVDIEMSNRCNLNCSMCWFHGESGIGDRYRDSEMTTGEVLKVIDQLAAYRPRLYFGGGEPFIREDFLTVVAHAKEAALSVSFTTNGTLFDEGKAREVVALGVDEINISIDGPEELHDRLRGQGNFQRTISNVRYLGERKRREHMTRPQLTANLTITPLIAGHLQETIDAVREATGHGIDFFRIHHQWFVTPEELRGHREAVGRSLGVSACGAEAHCIPLSRLTDPGALRREISALGGAGSLKYFPNLRGEEIDEFYSERYRPRKRCMAPFRTALVKPNGDVRFCPDEWIDDYVLGNVRHEHFGNIWNGTKARRFRSVLLRKGSFPGCKRCSWMHCF